jgi:hypothetical protein
MARKQPRRRAARVEYVGAPELIVVAKPEAGLRARRGARVVESVTGADVSALARVLKDGVSLVPLFGTSEERVIARAAERAAETGATGPDLALFYRVEAPIDRLESLAAELRDDPNVDAAYVKPAAELPLLNDMAASPADAPPVTPDFTASQVYLGDAPAGIAALWAHTRPGGKGNGVRIIDIEGAWRFTHEDLMQVQGGVIGGVQNAALGWRNHGTAVIGEFGGDENAFGITGICPNANTRAISIFLNAQGTSANTANAIRSAADALSAGDIILIELHRPGPRHDFEVRQDQLGYIAIEWWEDDWAAIKYATNKGVIVVEAAGNGAENLDDPIYNVRPPGFPSAWTNPFNRSNRDSGAILVGAGAPPPGTHGRDHGPDRSRLGFSNYGASLDAQGWGREVTTAGYGNLQGGTNEDEWYTDTFSGTSSASPIVVGAIGCVQGNRKALNLAVLTPAQMRQRLRTTGSPQTDAPGRPATQRIGNRPNLRQLIGIVKPGKEIVKEVAKEIWKEFSKEKENFKDVKDQTKEKNEKIEIKEQKQEKLEKLEKVEKLEKPEKNEKNEKLEALEKRPDKVREVIPGAAEMEPSVEARLAALEAAMGIAAPAPVPVVCTAFGSMPIGQGPNPLQGNQASFRVFQFNGLPAPFTQIKSQASPSGGVFVGLDCGFRTIVTLATPAQNVTLALVHFAQPANVRAFNSDGTLAGSAVMTPAQFTVQTLSIAGTSINRVIISCPQDETLLLRFCFNPIKPKEKHEGKELKEPKEFKEHKEHKEHKELKEPKELKELKEHKEFKEHKEKDKEKEKDKDFKEKNDIKDRKDQTKEIKESKEVKETLKEKEDLKEKEGLKEKDDKEIFETPGGGVPGSIESRLAALEAALGQVAHFIPTANRPDLSVGALSGEDDVTGSGGLASMSQDLQKAAADAKDVKDQKDVEKLGES